jgi:hypothetical protein
VPPTRVLSLRKSAGTRRLPPGLAKFARSVTLNTSTKRRGSSDFQQDVAPIEASKPVQLRVNPVPSRNDLRHEIAAIGAREHFAKDAGVLVGEHQRYAWQDPVALRRKPCSFQD